MNKNVTMKIFLFIVPVQCHGTFHVYTNRYGVTVTVRWYCVSVNLLTLTFKNFHSLKTVLGCLKTRISTWVGTHFFFGTNPVNGNFSFNNENWHFLCYKPLEMMILSRKMILILVKSQDTRNSTICILRNTSDDLLQIFRSNSQVNDVNVYTMTTILVILSFILYSVE